MKILAFKIWVKVFYFRGSKNDENLDFLNNYFNSLIADFNPEIIKGRTSLTNAEESFKVSLLYQRLVAQ